MGLLPKDIELLPPYDDRVFKLIMTSPEATPALLLVSSAIVNRPVINVSVRNTELPVTDTAEKAERFDVNCKIDDDTQADIEMQSSRMKEEESGEHNNLKARSISQDERERAIFRNRRIYQADQESNMITAVRNAEKVKATAIAKNLLGVGDSVDKIIAVTGLTRAEVEA
jgi:hypothetical protein